MATLENIGKRHVEKKILEAEQALNTAADKITSQNSVWLTHVQRAYTILRDLLDVANDEETG